MPSLLSDLVSPDADVEIGIGPGHLKIGGATIDALSTGDRDLLVDADTLSVGAGTSGTLAPAIRLIGSGSLSMVRAVGMESMVALATYIVGDGSGGRFQLRTDGKMVWGPGGASAVDVGLSKYTGPSGLLTDILTLDDNDRLRASVFTGDAAITRLMGGVDLTAMNMSTSSKYTAAIKFMSEDAELTTENPKLLAAIVGRATETYSADTAGGMAIDIATSANGPGINNVPTVDASFIGKALVLRPDAATLATAAGARLYIGDSTALTAADGIRFYDVDLYRSGVNVLRVSDGLEATTLSASSLIKTPLTASALVSATVPGAILHPSGYVYTNRPLNAGVAQAAFVSTDDLVVGATDFNYIVYTDGKLRWQTPTGLDRVELARATAPTLSAAASPGTLALAGKLITNNDAEVGGSFKQAGAFARRFVAGFPAAINFATVGVKIGEYTIPGASNNIVIAGKIEIQNSQHVATIDFVVGLRSSTLPTKLLSISQKQTTNGTVAVFPVLKIYEDLASGRIVLGLTAASGTYQSIGWLLNTFERADYNGWTQNSTALVNLDTTGLTEFVGVATTNVIDTGAIGGDLVGPLSNLQIGTGAIVNNDVNSAAAIARTKIAQPAIVTYPTALPAPSDGLEVYYVTAGGTIWSLRYRSAVSKWEVLGGAPLFATAQSAAANQTTAAVSTFTAMTNMGTLVVPLTGTYRWQATGSVQQTVAGTNEARVQGFEAAVARSRVAGFIGLGVSALATIGFDGIVNLTAASTLALLVATNNTAWSFGNPHNWNMSITPMLIG